jgi:hypothetical protein
MMALSHSSQHSWRTCERGWCVSRWFDCLAHRPSLCTLCPLVLSIGQLMYEDDVVMRVHALCLSLSSRSTSSVLVVHVVFFCHFVVCVARRHLA